MGFKLVVESSSKIICESKNGHMTIVSIACEEQKCDTLVLRNVTLTLFLVCAHLRGRHHHQLNSIPQDSDLTVLEIKTPTSS